MSHKVINDFLVIINDYFFEMGGGGVMSHCIFIHSKLAAWLKRSAQLPELKKMDINSTAIQSVVQSLTYYVRESTRWFSG